MYSRASSMAESAVVTTSTASATSPAGAGGDYRMQPPGEGRVGKAARRRPRASRKAPTTILNTDTTNFRAMVQQFTGAGPSRAPFQPAYPVMGDGVGSPANLSFGLVAGDAAQQPAVFPALGVQQQQYGQQYSHFQQHHERPLFMPGGTGCDDGYLPRFGSSNPQRGITDSPVDGFLLERISSSQMMSRPAASTGSSTTDGFFL